MLPGECAGVVSPTVDNRCDEGGVLGECPTKDPSVVRLDRQAEGDPREQVVTELRHLGIAGGEQHRLVNVSVRRVLLLRGPGVGKGRETHP